MTLGVLTGVGKEAADPGHYDAVMRKQLAGYLRKLGCAMDELKDISLTLIRGAKTVLPTVDALYDVICEAPGIDVSQERFGIVLRLLASCGGMQIVRRHLFDLRANKWVTVFILALNSCSAG